MRFFPAAAVASLMLLSFGKARACGVDIAPFGGGGSVRTAPQAFVFASGGVATRRPSESDARATVPFFMAGAGAEVYSINGVHFAPMLDVLVRGRANVATSTDLALVSRVSSDGFARGGFGAAIDLGVWTRAHGGRALGTLAGLTLGAPGGLQASWFVQQGSADVRGYAVVVGFDLARVQ